MAAYTFQQTINFSGHVFGSTYNSFPFGGECQIIEGSTGQYWNGSTYTTTPTWNATTVAADGLSHSYDWDTGSGVAGDSFIVTIRVKNDPDTESTGTIVLQSNGTSVTIVKPLFIFDD